MPVLRWAISNAVRLHANASKISSRLFVCVHSLPVAANPGHASTHSRQWPQRDSVTGSPVLRGASVRTRLSLMAEPNFSFTRRAHLPIHPSPASVATVLCGSTVECVFLSMPSSVAAELIAQNPRALSMVAREALSSPSILFTRSYSE
jgi:hypothetical protein